MIWKTAEGNFLLQGGVELIPLSSSIHLPQGESIDASYKYYYVAPDGRVIKVYSEPLPYSIDDTQGICNIHLVVGSKLYAFHWIEHDVHEPVVKEAMILSDLEACDPGALPFDPEQVIKAYERRAR